MLVCWMIGLQLVYGSAFVLLAVLRLRAGFRKEGGKSRSAAFLKRLGHARRFLPRPACGDDAMLWKERYVARTAGLTKLLAAIAVLGVVGLIVFSSADLITKAIAEQFGQGSGVGVRVARERLGIFLRAMTGAFTAVWLLAVSSAAATSITTEREGDTWISLLATPMQRHEYLRAKLLGSVWGMLPLPLFLLGYWLIGMVVGALHPAGLVVVALECCVFTAFAATLGLYFSLTTRNSSRSLAATMVTMIFLNGAYMLLCIPFQPDTPAIAAGCGPFLAGLGLMTSEDLGRLWTGPPQLWLRDTELFFASAAGTLFYAAGAALMGWLCYVRFDELAERPRSFNRGAMP